MSLRMKFSFTQQPFLSQNIQILEHHILLVYNKESNPAFCHQSFYKSDFSTFVCYFILFCADCIFSFFLTFSFIVWSSLVHP